MVQLQPTPLSDLYIVELRPHVDERGWFVRRYDDEVFREAGLCDSWCQSNLSFNVAEGTLRGLHFQAPPHPEIKLIQCLRGIVYDVIADLRPGSPTFGQTFSVTLEAAHPKALYVGAGLAHGFLTLTPDCLLSYDMSERYRPEEARGVRWDDPELAIAWPAEVRVCSERDQALPFLRELT